MDLVEDSEDELFVGDLVRTDDVTPMTVTRLYFRRRDPLHDAPGEDQEHQQNESEEDEHAMYKDHLRISTAGNE